MIAEPLTPLLWAAATGVLAIVAHRAQRRAARRRRAWRRRVSGRGANRCTASTVSIAWRRMSGRAGVSRRRRPSKATALVTVRRSRDDGRRQGATFATAIDRALRRRLTHLTSTACSTVRDIGEKAARAVAPDMKYAVVTFGCRVNQADSLAIEAELCARGAEAVGADQADLVIVNTCSVTASADQGARQTIRRIARENPSARIVATGCYATRCGDEVAALPGVVRVVPNAEKDGHRFVATLIESVTGASQSGDGPCGRPLAPGLMGRTAWTLRVQTGCEEVQLLHHPDDARREPKPDHRRDSRRGRSRDGRGVQGDRDHRRPSRLVWARSRPRQQRCLSSCGAGSMARRRCFGSARSNRWTSPSTCWTWALPPISICRCSMRRTACCD